MYRFVRILKIVVALAVMAAWAAAAEKPKAADDAGWRRLFDGKTLNGWKSANFGGEGEVLVRDGQIILEMGNNMTGVTSTLADLPKSNYEVSLEAMKLDGSDFFCGLTFPVRDSSCSLIVGGWGGGTVGLSSIDGNDASENQTTSYMKFDRNRWYRIRVRVTDEKIDCWIDDEHVVDVETAGHEFSIRSECDLSRPLGVANYLTVAALRNIKIREIAAEK